VKLGSVIPSIVYSYGKPSIKRVAYVRISYVIKYFNFKV